MGGAGRQRDALRGDQRPVRWESVETKETVDRPGRRVRQGEADAGAVRHDQLKRGSGLKAFERGEGDGSAGIVAGFIGAGQREQRLGVDRLLAFDGGVALGEVPPASGRQHDAGTGESQLNARAGTACRERVAGPEIKDLAAELQGAFVGRIGGIEKNEPGAESAAIDKQGKEMFPARAGVHCLRENGRRNQQQRRSDSWHFPPIPRTHAPIMPPSTPKAILPSHIPVISARREVVASIRRRLAGGCSADAVNTSMYASGSTSCLARPLNTLQPDGDSRCAYPPCLCAKQAGNDAATDCRS